jgi:hypothetical protein
LSDGARFVGASIPSSPARFQPSTRPSTLRAKPPTDSPTDLCATLPYGALNPRLRCPQSPLPGCSITVPLSTAAAYPDPVIPSQSPTPQTLAELAVLVEILQRKLEGEVQRARYLAATALTMAIVMPLVVYWALHGTL